MLRRFYNWLMKLAAGRHAPIALAAVSVTESALLPIPTDIMLIPMVLGHRERAWAYAALAAVTSVAGGLLGYLIGYVLLETVGIQIISYLGQAQGFAGFTRFFADYGLWIVIIKGLTPIPYKYVATAAGIAHMDLVTFVVASVLVRALRFFVTAGLLYVYGEPIRTFVEKRLILVMTGFVALVVVSIVVSRYLA